MEIVSDRNKIKTTRSKKKNCTTCGHDFGGCPVYSNDDKYLKTYEKGSKGLFAFSKADKYRRYHVCRLWDERGIQYPIAVSKINESGLKNSSYRDSEIGRFVKIRPCKDEYKDRTYLGLFLGESPIGLHISHNRSTKELSISYHKNPAIYVFDLKKIIYGIESWWGIIEKEEDLKEISDIDIDNVWYVKALKSMSE
jgi:hypothetical protein